VITSRLASVYGSLGYQVSTDLRVNGYLLRGSESMSGAGMDTHDSITTVQGGVSNRFSTGTSSWLLYSNARSGDNNYQRTNTSWDHYWNPQGGFNSLRSGFQYTRQTRSTKDFTETSVRGGAGWSLNRLDISGNATFSRLTSDAIDSNRSSSLIFSVAWRLADAWRLGADLSYNENLLTTNIAGDESRVTDRQLMVSLRYDAVGASPQSGRSCKRYLARSDTRCPVPRPNNNGVRDPGELERRCYRLSDRAQWETDANGEFRWSMATGGARGAPQRGQCAAALGAQGREAA
jgi:hypothetical protein